MSFFVLVSAAPPAVAPTKPEYDSRHLWMESLDGSMVLPIPLDGLPHDIVGRRGFLGLGVNPSELATSTTPGVPGSRVVDVVQPARPIAMPLAFLADDQVSLWSTVQKVRDLTDPTRGMTPEGNFRLVCTSSSGTRQLNLAYQSGLEDEDLERHGADQAVLVCTAPMPFAQERTDQTRPFRLAVGLNPFLSAPGSDFPWGTRQLAPSAIANSETPVTMSSAVPVWPVIEITGPATSVLVTSEAGLRIDVPGGILAGQTLRINTDPRHKSIRLNGAAAAGMLARGSRLVPFSLGTTLVDVSAPGATTDTLLRLTWRGLHRSLW